MTEKNINMENVEQVENNSTETKPKKSIWLFEISNAFAKSNKNSENESQRKARVSFKVNDVQKVYITLKEGAFLEQGTDSRTFVFKVDAIEKIVGYIDGLKVRKDGKNYTITEELNSFDLKNFNNVKSVSSAMRKKDQEIKALKSEKTKDEPVLGN